MKRFWLTSFLVLSIFLTAIWANGGEPYVNRLTAKPGPGSILLSWTDAEGWPGAVYEVWKAQKELTKNTLSQAEKVGTVPSGIEAFQDLTAKGPTFYLVLMKDSGGLRHNFFVPFRNKTSQAVEPGPALKITFAQVQKVWLDYAAPRINIHFESTPHDSKVTVYRWTFPIKNLDNLAHATILGTVTASVGVFPDSPPPGLSFYYAVVDSQALSLKNPAALTPDNGTVIAAGFPLLPLPPSLSITLPPASERPLPLPLLDVTQAPDTGQPLAPPPFEVIAAKPLSPKTQLTLLRWAKESVVPFSGLPELVILPEERIQATQEPDRTLGQIRRAYINSQDWKGAKEALELFLTGQLPVPTELRARFYHAEVLAYTKDYKRAFLEFLIVKDAYPEQTQPFLDALFTLLDSGQE